MKSIFHPDGKLMYYGNKLAQLLALDLIMLAFCLPVLTIGPSVAAMHYVLLRIYRNDDKYIFRMFWKSFRENLLQGAWMTVIYLFLFASVIYSYYLIYIGTMKMHWLIFALLVLVTVIIVTSCSWTFIFLSRYQDKTFRTLKNAATMVFVKPLYSIMILILTVTPLLGIVFLPQVFPLVVSLGFAGCGLLQTMLYSRIFNILEGVNGPSEQQNEKEVGHREGLPEE